MEPLVSAIFGKVREGEREFQLKIGAQCMIGKPVMQEGDLTVF